jgi:hypothetical protein
VRPDIRSACTAGRRSRNDILRWPFKFFYFFLFFSHPAGAQQWHPNNLYGDAKKPAPYRDNPDLEYRSVPSASGTVGSPGKISTRLMEWMTGPYWMSG